MTVVAVGWVKKKRKKNINFELIMNNPLSPSLFLQPSWTQVEFAAREMEHIIRSASDLIWSASTIASSCWTTGLLGSFQEGKESHRDLWEAEQWRRRGLSNSRSIVEVVRFFTAFLVTFHYYLSNLENIRSSRFRWGPLEDGSTWKEKQTKIIRSELRLFWNKTKFK